MMLLTYLEMTMSRGMIHNLLLTVKGLQVDCIDVLKLDENGKSNKSLTTDIQCFKNFYEL